MAGEELEKDTSVSREAKASVIDKTPNEHQRTAQANFDKEDYATNNQYGQDLSGIKYKAGIEDHYGDDASIGENDIKRMMDAGYSSDDVYNFSKKRGLNYNQHGQKYMKGQGDYQIGKGSDQWGDVFGSKEKSEPTPEKVEATESIQPASTPTVTEKPNVTFPSATGPGGPQSVYQDNDINSSVNGNDNEVNISQDNSVRQYGGTNKKANLGATNLMDNYVLNLRKSRQAG